MDLRKCTLCGEERSFDCFRKIKTTKLGLLSRCRECESILRNRDKDKQKQYQKEYYSNNSERLKNYQKEYAEKNFDKIANRKSKNYKKKSSDKPAKVTPLEDSSVVEKVYYVYLHRRIDNGVVFYVGKGCDNRANRPRRSNRWKEVADQAGGFSVEYVSTGLTQDAALELEMSLLKNPRPEWQLTNCNRVNNRVLPVVFDDFHRYFYYDETSPTCLRWKTRNSSRCVKNLRQVGDVAGYVHSSTSNKKYYTVKVSGKSYLVHRIIWTLFNHNLSQDLVINHIDGDGFNNLLSNLEAITPATNARRTKRQSRPSVGVRFMRVGKHSYWVASWNNQNCKRKTKLFSVLKHGDEEAFRLATEHRRLQIEWLNSRFDLGYL